MAYNLISEIKLTEQRLLFHGKDVFEHPPIKKWERQDCPQCHNAFCVSNVSKKSGGGLMCFKCGYRPKGV
ncbi:MAG: hypothetical protein ABFD63_01200 [Smithella sp.]